MKVLEWNNYEKYAKYLKSWYNSILWSLFFDLLNLFIFLFLLISIIYIIIG